MLDSSRVRCVVDSSPALPQPPVVDDVAEHVDGRGQHMRADHGRRVLVQATRKLKAAGIPERPPEYLVPRRTVLQEDRIAGGVRTLGRYLEYLLMRRGRPDPGRVEPQYAAAGDIRAGFLQRSDEQFVRMRGQQVVAVEEGEVFAGGEVSLRRYARARGPDFAVARGGNADRASAKLFAMTALPSLDPSSTMMTSRSPKRLPGDRLKRCFEIRLHVVAGHDNAELRHVS